MGASISLAGVGRSYKRGTEIVRALHPTSLDIPAGAFATIMGPSGSGKSTLLHLIAGFDHPETGEIRIGQQRQVEGGVPGRIGFIFQNFRLSPLLSASENVELALLPLKRTSKERKSQALAALEDVGLADRRSHRPSELSGGQQQRVSVARAVAPSPDIILADEPTANLDSSTGEQIMKLLQRLGRSSGCTIVVATHDPRWSSVASLQISMKDGGIVQ